MGSFPPASFYNIYLLVKYHVKGWHPSSYYKYSAWYVKIHWRHSPYVCFWSKSNPTGIKNDQESWKPLRLYIFVLMYFDASSVVQVVTLGIVLTPTKEKIIKYLENCWGFHHLTIILSFLVFWCIKWREMRDHRNCFQTVPHLSLLK